MGLHYIDGERFHRTLSAGVRRLLSRQDYLNKINVFPVPDSDTGTNMGFTLSSIENPVILENIDFPEPVIFLAIEPNTKSDQEKLSISLEKLS